MTDMITRYLRPVTTEEFYQRIFESVDVPHASIKNWRFGIQDYDIALHAQIAKMILQARRMFDLLFYNAKIPEMVSWPKEHYGSKARPGILRAICKLLGIFEEYFIEKITEDVLKTFTTIAQLFLAMEKVNHDLCTEAKALKVGQSQYTKPPDLNLFAASFLQGAKDASLQTSFNAGKQYNRHGDGTPLGAPFHQNQPDHRGNSNTGQARYSARPDHRPQANDSSSRFGRPDARAQGNNPTRGVPFSRHSALAGGRVLT